MNFLEQELNAAEELLNLIVRRLLDGLTLEVLRGKNDVVPDRVVRAELNALRSIECAIIRRSIGCTAEVTVGDIRAPRTLVRSICTLVLERNLTGFLGL